MLSNLVTWTWLGWSFPDSLPCARAREDIYTPGKPSQRVWEHPSSGEGVVELVLCCCCEQHQPEQREDGAGFVKINKSKEKALNVFPQQL